MGTLKVGTLDFNKPGTFGAIRNAIAELARPAGFLSWASGSRGPYYFQVTGSQLPNEAGWYIILDGTQPLYVGKADNLDARLNTNDGSRDNFGNNKRQSDAERNFIKRFIEIGVIATPRVCIIRRSELAAAVQISEDRLTDTDAGNIEKIINLMRDGFAYL